jgi:FkbM family methyltransferase
MAEQDDIWSKAFSLLGAVDVKTVFDVGANRGEMTRVLLDRFPDAAIYSFEPDPDTFAGLHARYENEPRVHPVNCAAASATGPTAFHRGADNQASSLYPRNKTGRRYYYSDFVMIEEITVSAVTLDEFCRAQAINHIDLIKFDLQGGEFEALSGATGLLAAGAIDVIVSEFFLIPHYEGAPLLDRIWSLLRSFGYDIYDLHIAKYGNNGQARWGDAIFVSAGHRQRHLDTFPEER